MYREIKDDLFKEKDRKDILYIQCISADLAMGAGIATQFNKYFDTKNNILKFKNESKITNDWIPLEIGDYIYTKPVISLITKNKYWHKHTLENLFLSLDGAEQCINDIIFMNNITEIRLPKIGCGLDKLKWTDVKPKIIELSKKIDIDIVVYYK